MAKVIDAVVDVLNYVRREAVSREDGNTTALVDKVLRDVNQLQPEYRALTFNDMHGINADEGAEFTAGSYEKTGAQDVNIKPLPPTGEDADAPFVPKSDTNETKVNADNPEEKSTGAPKSGKVAKANT